MSGAPGPHLEAPASGGRFTHTGKYHLSNGDVLCEFKREPHDGSSVVIRMTSEEASNYVIGNSYQLHLVG